MLSTECWLLIRSILGRVMVAPYTDISLCVPSRWTGEDPNYLRHLAVVDSESPERCLRICFLLAGLSSTLQKAPRNTT